MPGSSPPGARAGGRARGGAHPAAQRAAHPEAQARARRRGGAGRAVAAAGLAGRRHRLAPGGRRPPTRCSSGWRCCAATTCCSSSVGRRLGPALDAVGGGGHARGWPPCDLARPDDLDGPTDRRRGPRRLLGYVRNTVPVPDARLPVAGAQGVLRGLHRPAVLPPAMPTTAGGSPSPRRTRAVGSVTGGRCSTTAGGVARMRSSWCRRLRGVDFPDGSVGRTSSSGRSDEPVPEARGVRRHGGAARRRGRCAVAWSPRVRSGACPAAGREPGESVVECVRPGGGRGDGRASSPQDALTPCGFERFSPHVDSGGGRRAAGRMQLYRATVACAAPDLRGVTEDDAVDPQWMSRRASSRRASGERFWWPLVAAAIAPP